MDKFNLIKKELEKLGIKNDTDLQKAIQELPPINLFMMASKKGKIK